MNLKSFIVFVVLLWNAPFTFAADAQQQVQTHQAIRLFDEWAQATFAFDRIPGTSVGFVSDQKLVWSKGYGYADVGRKVQATPETLYGICSISKLFTAIAVLQQRDAGKIRLDDSVDQYLPYAKLEPASKDSAVVTVESLLTHSSGLPRESAHPYWTDPDFKFPTKEEMISGLRSQKMLYPSEHYFQYSNLGLAFAGELVEKVTGQSFEQYVQEQILKPLSLANTTPFLPREQRGKSLATGYGALTRDGKREVMPFYETRGIAPAAGFASNVNDLAAFASWQFRLLAKGGTEVLKASTLREMQRVHWIDPNWETTWGLGFWVGRIDQDTYVGHDGGCPGYFTSLLLNPKKKIAAIVMMNAMNVPTGRIAQQMLKIVGSAIEEEGEPGKKKAQPKSPNRNFELFSGVYGSAWGETIVVPWKDGLAALDLPSRTPMDDLAELKHVEGKTFRRVRKDGDQPGEEVTFETGEDGRVTRLLWHQNYSRKIR